jgi:hypothetical protein
MREVRACGLYAPAFYVAIAKSNPKYYLRG